MKERDVLIGQLNEVCDMIDWIGEHYPDTYNEYVKTHKDTRWKKV